MNAAPITLGSDPEFFLFQHGGPSTAQLVGIEGEKDKPINLKARGKVFYPEYKYHRDNVMLEISTPIANSVIEWYEKQSRGMEFARTIAKQHGAQILNRVDHVRFPDDLLRRSGPTALEIGCSPDQDAYMAGQFRTAPDPTRELGLHRTAGGHVHIGTSKPFNCPPFIVAMLMDWATLPGRINALRQGTGASQYFALAPEPPPWYRRLGLYREKPYGIEYRSLGGLWVHNISSTVKVGQAGFAVGHYCATQPAKKIRALVDSINWASVHRCMDWTFNRLAKRPKEEFLLTFSDVERAAEEARRWTEEVSGEHYGTI